MVEYYLVGGAVRDKYLGLEVKDRDWLVVGATPDDLISQGFQQVGKGFPVFLHPKTKEEYALARTEKKAGSGYTGFICDFAPTISLEEDLRRRDLTINAMAEDQTGKLYDFYGGKSDLDKRILRHVSVAFTEDPLRILRVARFAARFAILHFEVAPETILLMQKMTQSGELQTLTPERIWQETLKALNTDCPWQYFNVLNDVGALVILFPELHAYLTEHQDFLFSYQNATKSKKICDENKCLYHFVLIFYKLSENNIQNLCQRLKVTNEFKQFTLAYCQYYNLFETTNMLTAQKILTYFNAIDIWRHPEFFAQLCQFANWKNANHNRRIIEILLKVYRSTKIIDVQQIIRAGFRQAEIRSELNRQRLTLIAKTLSEIEA